MPLIIIAAAVINLIMLVIFFRRLKEISSATRATSYIGMYSQFIQDPKLRKMNEALTFNNSEISQLVASEPDTLIYYLDFIEFIILLYEDDSASLAHLKTLFNRPIKNIKTTPEIVSVIRSNTGRYPRLNELLARAEQKEIKF